MAMTVLVNTSTLAVCPARSREPSCRRAPRYLPPLSASVKLATCQPHSIEPKPPKKSLSLNLRNRRPGARIAAAPKQMSTCPEKSPADQLTIPIAPLMAAVNPPSKSKISNSIKHLSAATTRARLGIQANPHAIHRHALDLGSAVYGASKHQKLTRCGDGGQVAATYVPPKLISQPSRLPSADAIQASTAPGLQMSVLESCHLGGDETRTCFTQGDDEDLPEFDILLMPEFGAACPVKSVSDARKNLRPFCYRRPPRRVSVHAIASASSFVPPI